MPRVPPGAPFDEQGGRLRGVVDLAAGRYPPFLFGLPVGELLPVFHFHETSAAALEPALRYLVENGYRTVVSDDVAALVRERRHPGPKSVMLAFDDAWASLWLVVGPLLEKYGMRAVTYAIPSRLAGADTVRPTLADGPVDAEAADRAANPFVTWPELEALSASGLVDVQSHSWSHSMVFSGPDVVAVSDPRRGETLLSRPRLNTGEPPEFLAQSRVGYPLFPRRSRLSDAVRFLPDPGGCARVEQFVEARGGTAFLDRPTWRADLEPLLGAIAGRSESEDERRRAVEFEISAARDALEGRLHVPVRHICLPWGVSGRVTRAALERLGVVTAFANRTEGRFAVAAGDDPFFLKRVHSRHIFALPGRGRRPFATFVTRAG